MTFTVPGNPVPWERARTRGGTYYTARRSQTHRTVVQAHARQARVLLIEGPVRLDLEFWRSDQQPCDLDNLVKLLQDALTGIAYRDDRQVVEIHALRAVDPGHPRTVVTVQAIPGPAGPVP